ncbi:MFS general substrate transporter [Daldinia caldariorum]|uniref:MFS general substrate transporter n=1 Tax=Daldinia caldariorum TaxID=326644 RepID=UPI002007CC98|nr:MFS general substrate transporter [Daldinia caldariorum]KAI1465823.1 MFS general substrate transporter [Daldinia caldariorum]
MAITSISDTEDVQKIEQKRDSSTNGESGAFTTEEEQKLDRKIRWKRDIVIIPIMGTLYMLLFLDRTNIANARSLGIDQPTGLENALDMPSYGYNTALWIFYIPFVLTEVPANLILNLNKIRPGIFLGGQVFLLGVLGMCQGLTASYGGLLAVRFLLGVFEAALPAGATYMISLYYTKREASNRFAWFFNFALAGPLFSGLLAYALEKMEGVGGYEGWRWIFIIEGLMTCVLSAIIFWLCPNFPREAQSWFLSTQERDRLIDILEASRGLETEGSAADNVPVWKVLVDWRIHLLTLCFFCVDVTASSIASFLPTILTEMDWMATTAQLMLMPIWAAGIVSTFIITWLASRLNFRAPFLLFSISLQIVGWSIIAAYPPNAIVRYVALCFMTAGTYPQMSILTGWLSANLRGRKYLAVGMAWMVGFGNCANFISSNAFITTEHPQYPTGVATGLAFTILGFVLTWVVFILLILGNKRRDRIRAQLTDDEREHYNELHFKFVY